MYMSQNVVDMVYFGILSEKRLENLNICMSQNVVDLVDFVFHRPRRLEISNTDTSIMDDFFQIFKVKAWRPFDCSCYVILVCAIFNLLQ